MIYCPKLTVIYYIALIILFSLLLSQELRKRIASEYFIWNIKKLEDIDAAMTDFIEYAENSFQFLPRSLCVTVVDALDYVVGDIHDAIDSARGYDFMNSVNY